jgi:predicted PhzF superfamily epimerase YddE/YHI9
LCAIVDAFTSAAFSGNPAAIVLLPAFSAFPSDDTMQKLASEFNLSETAFTFRRGDGPGYALRWFTPASEVQLCGHATLAAAHALVTIGSAVLPLTFHTRSGPLTVSRCAVGGVQYDMDFPAQLPAEAIPAAASVLAGMLAAALPGSPAPLWIGRTDGGDTVVQLPDEASVRHAVPVPAGLAALGGGAGGVDFVSRAFFPLMGVAEDPVTGSAHCALAPFWAARLGKNSLTGAQIGARGGRVACRYSPDTGRVVLSGVATTIMRGEIECPLA